MKKNIFILSLVFLWGCSATADTKQQSQPENNEKTAYLKNAGINQTNEPSEEQSTKTSTPSCLQNHSRDKATGTHQQLNFKGVPDQYYPTLATSIAAILVVAGAFIIFQYQNIGAQTTETYNRFRLFLSKEDTSLKIKDILKDDAAKFKDYQDDKDKFDSCYSLWLEKDILPRFKPYIVLFGLRDEEDLKNSKGSPELYGLCDYYLALKAQEKFKEDFRRQFKYLLNLNCIFFIASLAMVLFQECFTLSLSSLLALGFLAMTSYIVLENVGWVSRSVNDVEYERINNWEHSMKKFNEKYSQKKVDDIVAKVKKIRNKR